jgi:hypothetical protein
MAVVLYGPSVALSQVTGLHIWLAVGSCGIVCTLYTSIVCDGFLSTIYFDLMHCIGWNESSDLDRCGSGYCDVSWHIFVDHIWYDSFVCAECFSFKNDIQDLSMRVEWEKCFAQW